MRRVPQVDHGAGERRRAARPADDKNRTPAKKITDHADQGTADKIVADQDRKPAADGDLAPLNRHRMRDHRMPTGNMPPIAMPQMKRETSHTP